MFSGNRNVSDTNHVPRLESYFASSMHGVRMFEASEQRVRQSGNKPLGSFGSRAFRPTTRSQRTNGGVTKRMIRVIDLVSRTLKPCVEFRLISSSTQYSSLFGLDSANVCADCSPSYRASDCRASSPFRCSSLALYSSICSGVCEIISSTPKASWKTLSGKRRCTSSMIIVWTFARK